MYRNITCLIMAMVILMNCQSAQKTAESETPGIDLSMMDTTVSPKEDFFRYVNGAWLAQVDMPADRGRWGSFDELRKRTSNQVLRLLESSALEDFKEGSDQYKAFVFYQTAMDTQHANELGTQPIQPFLDQIEDIESMADLQGFIEDMEPLGLRAFIGFGVSPDLRNSQEYATYLSNGALGLPDRDYYVKDDEESQRIRGEYQDHVERMLQFLDYTEEQAVSAAERILAFETAMAEPRMDKVQRRNPLLRYNKRSVDQLEEMMPEFDWSSYFTNIGVEDIDTIIVSEPKYIESLSSTLSDFSVADWKHYLKWTVLDASATLLSQEIDKANFEFFGKKLRGTEAQRPRWERIIDVTNATLGEALGKLYVDEYFPKEAKTTAKEMVDNILKAFEKRIDNLEWMTDSTKMKAQEKLNSFTVKVGYPDKWKDYSDLVVQTAEEGSYAQNMINVRKYLHNRDLNRIGEEVDDTEWFMPPQMVNAYYNPLQNEIVFPAAILQPPFYNYKADPAVNYGGIGAVIGHEISHGFDDQGSRFDAEGNMNNWWTERDREQFEALHQKLIDQFDSYEPLEGVNVNGAYTLGENIGDLGGINAAYDALQIHLEEHGNPGKIDGYTQEQRFFLSWGTIWRIKYRDETLKTLIKTDPHSPGMYRAIGPLSNFEPFYDAFGIEEGDETYRADSIRVEIW
ncbi:MAG: M13 family metallopeptidase [Saprospiraceae bacterium]|nr:M13 family metallopeptidase [Saprospiraceae bacterium]